MNQTVYSEQARIYDHQLINAAYKGDLVAVKEALHNGANINHREGETALVFAIQFNRKEVFDFLIDQGVDIHLADDFGWTPLLEAANYCRCDMLFTLLTKGSDVNVENNDKNTALLISAMRADYYSVKVLLEKGANVEHRNKDGVTVIDFAKEVGKLDVIKLLESDYQKSFLEDKKLQERINYQEFEQGMMF